MATFGTYTVSFDACDSSGCTTIAQPFVVEHLDNPAVTGGLRRRTLCQAGMTACPLGDGQYEVSEQFIRRVMGYRLKRFECDSVSMWRAISGAAVAATE